jgi:hypothetical protein
VLSKDVSVSPGASVRLDESELVAADDRLALKGSAPRSALGSEPAFDPPSAHDSLPASTWELRLALGTSTGRRQTFGSPLYSTASDDDAADGAGLERELSGVASLTYAITDRLSWSVPMPAFAYRFGTEGAFTTIARGGLTALGYSSIEGLIGNVDAGVGARAWLAPDLSLLATASADWAFGAPARERIVALHGALGLSWQAAERVQLALGVGWSGGVVVDDVSVRTADGTLLPLSDDVEDGVVLGAVQSLGYRPLPLLQIYVTDWLSLDAYASWAIQLDSGDVRDRYLAGFSWAF